MFWIGIAGGSGSGKTTFARKLVDKVGVTGRVAVLSQDHYYLPRSDYPAHLRLPSGGLNDDHPDAFDWTLLRRHLDELNSGREIEVPEYDYAQGGRRPKGTRLAPVPVMILEGIFSLWDATVLGNMNLRIFVDVESDVRLIRRLHRDIAERGRTVDQVVGRYYETVRPMHVTFVQPTQRSADLVVGEENDLAAETVAARIRQELEAP